MKRKSNNEMYSYNGEELTATEWAELLGIHIQTFLSRIKAGWDIERILTTPNSKDDNKRLITIDGETHCIKEWTRIQGFKRSTIPNRLRNGWNERDAVCVPLQPSGRREKGPRYH